MFNSWIKVWTWIFKKVSNSHAFMNTYKSHLETCIQNTGLSTNSLKISTFQGFISQKKLPKKMGKIGKTWSNHCSIHTLRRLSRDPLKGKFSSAWDRGRSSINIKSQFQLKTTDQKLFFVCFCDVFKVYLSNIDSETAEIFFF